LAEETPELEPDDAQMHLELYKNASFEHETVNLAVGACSSADDGGNRRSRVPARSSNSRNRLRIRKPVERSLLVGPQILDRTFFRQTSYQIGKASHLGHAVHQGETA
jgi:hypothetical protein